MRAIPFLLLLLVAGCTQPAESPKMAAPPVAKRSGPTPPTGGAGIAPLGSPAAGGLTPVGNSDSVLGAGGGGGGGTAQAAKSQARRAAAGASGAESATTGQTTGD